MALHPNRGLTPQAHCFPHPHLPSLPLFHCHPSQDAQPEPKAAKSRGKLNQQRFLIQPGSLVARVRGGVCSELLGFPLIFPWARHGARDAEGDQEGWRPAVSGKQLQVLLASVVRSTVPPGPPPGEALWALPEIRGLQGGTPTLLPSIPYPAGLSKAQQENRAAGNAHPW